MQFIVDKNVRKEVVDFLKAKGYDVISLTAGLEDEKIAQTAKETKRILLTHDQHFANILAYPPKEYSGIIRIKIHPPTADSIINALENLFQKLSTKQIDKKLIILEKNGFRIR
ncbi:MAG: DUF5615 family PIN-like protein [Candidatus Omnitrophica bacterium]|nr:DUF5615 family PIN-like protein [Candidatus Omnitrophota bacterium]